jgi:hypothetical protein
VHARATDGVVAGAFAGIVSGAPSTIYALLTGGDPLAATAAAGTLLLPEENDRRVLIAAAVPVHSAISVGWGIVLARVLPRRNEAWWGAAAGVAIAVFDLKVIGPRAPKIAALPFGPQLADHIAFGVVAGWMIGRKRRA